MYARIARAQVPLDRIDDLINAFKSNGLPQLRNIPGYAGHSMAIDRSSGDGQVAVFWESREALDGSRDKVAPIRDATTKMAGATIVSVTEYEQLVRETTAPASTPAFLRVTRGQLDLGKVDGLVTAMRDEAVPALKALNGFRALVVAVDRSSGSFLITTVWDSAANRESSDSAIDELRRRIFSGAGVGPPEVARYEVQSVEFVGAGAIPG